MAAAFALLSSEQDRRTLLVSTDPAHSTSDILEASLGPDPTLVAQNFWAMEIDPERETDLYIEDVKQRIADTTAPRLRGEVERQIDIARVTPGAAEAALFDRFTRIMDDAGPRFDRILFDTAPTGHTLRLLSLPELMTAWISGLISRRKKVNVLGRMWRNVAGAAAGDVTRGSDPVLAALEQRKERFQHARRLVTDADQTAFIFVVIPERLPILETEKAIHVLDKYGIPVGAVVVNRILPETDESEFLSRRQEREAGYLERIHEAFADHPVFHLPLFDADVIGSQALRKVIAELPEEERTAARDRPEQEALH